MKTPPNHPMEDATAVSSNTTNAENFNQPATAQPATAQSASEAAARRDGNWNKAMRVAGVVFVAAGAFKLMAPVQPGFAGGGRGFGQALATIRVPFPGFFGYAIPLLEIAGGALLCGSWRRAQREDATAQREDATGRGEDESDNIAARRMEGMERVVCVLLACDMIGAIALVGVPGALGHPLRVGKNEIGNEAWRLPLEIALLWIVMKRARRAAI